MASVLDGYVTENEMADERDCTVRTLQRERRNRVGPPWVKFGSKIYYRIEAARAYLQARERQPVRDKVA